MCRPPQSRSLETRFRPDGSRWCGLALLVLLRAGCAPRTDLFGEASSGGGDPVGGSAAGALIDPPAGTADVPSNLAAIAVRLPVALALDAAGANAPFRLRASAARSDDGSGGVALGTALAMACAGGLAGSCYRIPVAAVLAPSTSYLFELLAGAIQQDGAPAATGAIGAFDTAASSDETPPQVIDFSIALAGPCAGVRFSTDEPVTAQVVVRAASDAGASDVGDNTVERITEAGTGQTAFDLAVPLGGLAPATRAEIRLRVTDRAGNAIEASTGEIELPPATPPLVITEVLANPAGPEPGQEFVELRNVGGDELSLAGLRLEDSRGADVLPEAVLAAGAYALVIPSTFDPASPRDVAPRAGTLMVPVDTRLGSDGLSNTGEVVRLRLPGTGTEAVISSYGGWIDVSAASAAGKSAQRVGDGSCDHPSAWTKPPRLPTPGWGTQ